MGSQDPEILYIFLLICLIIFDINLNKLNIYKEFFLGMKVETNQQIFNSRIHNKESPGGKNILELPDNIIFEIFKHLGFIDLKNVNCTCKKLNSLIMTTESPFIRPDNIKFTRFTSKYLSQSFELTNQTVLTKDKKFAPDDRQKITLFEKNGIIACDYSFGPYFKAFSFKNSIEQNGCRYFGHIGSIIFCLPPGETFSKSLIIIDVNKPEKKSEITFSEEIINCFPFGNELAIITQHSKIYFYKIIDTAEFIDKLDLKNEKLHPGKVVGNFLLLEKKILNLQDRSLISYPENSPFSYSEDPPSCLENVMAYNSTFYINNDVMRQIECFTLDAKGQIKRLWECSFDTLVDQSNFDVNITAPRIFVRVVCLNEKYTIIQLDDRNFFWQRDYKKPSDLFVLNIKGEIILSLSQKFIGGDSLVSLCDDMLIYQSEKNVASFYYIPSAKCIHKWNFGKFIKQHFMLRDISYYDEKLYLVNANYKTNEYHILEFDSKNEKKTTQGTLLGNIQKFIFGKIRDLYPFEI